MTRSNHSNNRFIDQKIDDCQWEESTFEARLRHALAGRTVAWLSRESGLLDGTIRNYFKGTRPKFAAMLSIASALGVNPIWLQTGNGAIIEKKAKEATRAEGFDLFDANENDWLFLPFYKAPKYAPTTLDRHLAETYPVRRDWLRAALGGDTGFWLTEMPTDELPTLAAKGDTIVCRSVLLLQDGGHYIFARNGELIARWYFFGALLKEGEDMLSPSLPAKQAHEEGVVPIGQIFARLGLSPIKPPKPI